MSSLSKRVPVPVLHNISTKALRLNTTEKQWLHIMSYYWPPRRDIQSPVWNWIGKGRNLTNGGLSLLLGGYVLGLSFSNTGNGMMIQPPVRCSNETQTPQKQNTDDVKNNNKNGTKKREDVDNDDNDETSCPMCRFFLESACRDVFQKWHYCIQVRGVM
jgi:hypothetical protein